MLRQPHTSSREIIVANAIREVVNELRLVDPADYIALIRLESMASLSDIVMSAAELYLMPGTLGLGHGSEVHISWTEPPRIVLDLELRPKGVRIYLKLTLSADAASVELGYVAFDRPSDDPEANTLFLQMALENARLRRTSRAGCGTQTG